MLIMTGRFTVLVVEIMLNNAVVSILEMSTHRGLRRFVEPSVYYVHVFTDTTHTHTCACVVYLHTPHAHIRAHTNTQLQHTHIHTPERRKSLEFCLNILDLRALKSFFDVV